MLYPWNVTKLNPLFAPDDGTGGGGTETETATEEAKAKADDTSADDGKNDWTSAQQAEFDKRAAALKKAAKESGKAEALAEIEKKNARAKEEADKARLVEEGKYKELTDKAEAAKLAAEARAQEAEEKAATANRLIAFRDTVSDLEIQFVDGTARQDAFDFLDLEMVGEENKGMEKAVKSLMEKRPYLFKNGNAEASRDSREKGKKPADKLDTTEESSLRSRFRIRTPR